MIRVVSVAGLCSVQDRGRPGFMHLGVPPGGALVRGALARANAAVGNEAGAAGLEVFGRLVIEAEAPAAVATDRGPLVELAPGGTIVVESGMDRVRYLAVRGGIDVPLRLGARATLLVAGFGGFEGRGLRRGDVLPIGQPAARARAHTHAHEDEGRSFRPWAGTELGQMNGSWTISPESDRVGVRLIGEPVIVAPIGQSVPMVQGAIQVPPDGQPIVLGPDHPTTGGYPVIGFLDDADFDRFFATPIGARVTFTGA